MKYALLTFGAALAVAVAATVGLFIITTVNTFVDALGGIL